jgi:HEPN domain-containing protein
MPINVSEQIEYWHKGALEDMDAATVLLEKNKIRHSLFFAHLSVEKMLKAHVVKATNDLPPRTHDLLRLAERSGLRIEPSLRSFLARFQQHCLEGRYPDSPQGPAPSAAEARAELSEAQGVLEWLRKQLS